MWADLAGDITAEFAGEEERAEYELRFLDRMHYLREQRKEANQRYDAKRLQARKDARAAAPKRPGRPLQATCKAGHAYEGDNLVVWADGRRRCATCLRASRAHKLQPAVNA